MALLGDVIDTVPSLDNIEKGFISDSIRILFSTQYGLEEVDRFMNRQLIEHYSVISFENAANGVIKMAKIMIRATSESDRKSIVEALDDDVHELLGADQAPVPTDDPAEVIADSGADVVITEYIEQDAWSVKVMQDVALRLPFTRFIFLLSQETPLHHLVLAVNEGAAAMLPRPLDSTAIKNYVNRALNRQKRDREWAAEVEQCRQLAEKEKNCSMEQAVEISELKRSLRTGYSADQPFTRP